MPRGRIVGAIPATEILGGGWLGRGSTAPNARLVAAGYSPNISAIADVCGPHTTAGRRAPVPMPFFFATLDAEVSSGCTAANFLDVFAQWFEPKIFFFRSALGRRVPRCADAEQRRLALGVCPDGTRRLAELLLGVGGGRAEDERLQSQVERLAEVTRPSSHRKPRAGIADGMSRAGIADGMSRARL